MNIKSYNPSSIIIKQLNNFINVTYEEQPFTCNKCGKTGHRARSCRVKTGDYLNTIHINLFDTDEDYLNDSVIEYEDLDIHIDPSQNSNKFDCPKCEYTCTYENILIDHMEFHTQEESRAYVNIGHQPKVVSSLFGNKKDVKQIECHICEFACDNDTSLKEHMITHDNEILLNCTECDFNCRNEDVLNIHLASHNIYLCNICNSQCKSEKELCEHVKLHSGKNHKVTESDYTSTSASRPNNHKQNHTG